MRGRTPILRTSRTAQRGLDPKMQPSIAMDAISTCCALGQSYVFQSVCVIAGQTRIELVLVAFALQNINIEKSCHSSPLGLPSRSSPACVHKINKGPPSPKASPRQSSLFSTTASDPTFRSADARIRDPSRPSDNVRNCEPSLPSGMRLPFRFPLSVF